MEVPWRLLAAEEVGVDLILEAGVEEVVLILEVVEVGVDLHLGVEVEEVVRQPLVEVEEEVEVLLNQVEAEEVELVH